MFITPYTTGIFSWKGYKLYFSQSKMLTSNVQLDYVLTRGGGQAVQGGLSCPPPRISERKIIHIFITPSTTGIFSWKGYKLYFSQSEMLTSKVQLGYVLTRDGGQAVQSCLSCPAPRISERMDNLQILLHHLLQEYLAERDINFTEMLTSNVRLGCVLRRGGGQAVQGGLSCPPPAQNFRENG